jgi:hypothetical protein
MKRAERLKDSALKTSQVRTCRVRVEKTAVTPVKLSPSILVGKSYLGAVARWKSGENP